MPVFKYSRRDGAQQVATEDELSARDGGESTDAHKEIDLPTPPGYHHKIEPLKRAERLSENASGAFRALFRDMYKQGVPWCKKYINKIDSMHELGQVRAKEQEHPKYEGGRTGIFDAIMEREEELRAENAPPAPPADEADDDDEVVEEEAEEEEEEEAAETFPCPHCDFMAGSKEGLEAHIEATHTEL